MMIKQARDLWQDAEFRKSSYSGGANGACVEVAWRKSSYSGGENGACVEIAHGGEMFGVRDSKNAGGPVLTLSAEQGRRLVAAVKDNRLTQRNCE